MDTLLWIIQWFLAVVFFYSGIMKSTQNREKLVSIGQTGVADLPYSRIRLIGMAEILGSLGIILPWKLQIAAFLTPVAALCFAVIMLLAIPIHYKRHELRSVSFNIFILLISIFVAIGRFL